VEVWPWWTSFFHGMEVFEHSPEWILEARYELDMQETHLAFQML
jgi:hypothetical protein